jgi:hypothetical protein
MADPICIGDGWIVGMGGPLPTNPREYYSVPSKIVGCNRLKCRNCGEWVRHFDDCRLKAINAGVEEYQAFYEAKDPLKFYFVEPDKGMYRVYCCRCAFADVPFTKSVETLDLPNWYCAGHPQD